MVSFFIVRIGDFSDLPLLFDIEYLMLIIFISSLSGGGAEKVAHMLAIERPPVYP